VGVELKDAGGYAGVVEQIFRPETEAELQAILRDAYASGTPVTIGGSWTGLAGGSIGHEGWMIGMERFRKLEILDGKANVGAGVILRDLQAAARATGQIYAPDPTENTASLGGMIANNASGSRCFYWKATRAHIEALRVAFADGSLRTFRRGEAIDFEVPEVPQPDTTKHSVAFPLRPGMDWVDLFIGSEGILGIVIEAEVKLHPAHKGELLTGVFFFKTEESAWDAVDAWRSTPGLRMLEYMDHGSLELLKTQPGGARAALMIEAEIESPEQESIWDERLEWDGLLADDSWVAASAADRERFRVFRHTLPEKVNETVIRNGFMKVGSDCAVPLARNQEMLRWYREVVEREMPGQYVVYGHIGDAHVHVNLLPKTQEQFDAAKRLMEEFAKKAASMGGTVSAEHGLGKRKAHFLKHQYAKEHIDAMIAVKSRLDPKWLLGRGTLLPFSA
jgi:FAD/FMN-containing dehydrogenase